MSSKSGRVINIIPKLSPDELQDEREIRDPKFYWGLWMVALGFRARP